MIHLGRINTLTVMDFDPDGAYFDGGDEGEILLPRAEIPAGCEIGQELEVFIYLDSEDLLTATTSRPLAMVGEFAVLEVVSIERVGAFLDWGLSKDLLLPFSEQTRDLNIGDYIIVFVYIDKSDRISASMRLHRHADKRVDVYKPGQAVELLIAAKTDLGYNAIINGRHIGVLYSNEVFQPLHYAERKSGYIKAVRPDGKIDLSLTQAGHHAANEDIGPKIMELLKAEGGFLAINDKTPAEEIHRHFGVSRKKFKIALGGLYKRRLIKIEDDGIRLV